MEKSGTRVEDFFKSLQKVQNNDKCFDCDAKDPTWASINNGIFLCANCSTIHRELGIAISLIRSTVYDIWSER